MMRIFIIQVHDPVIHLEVDEEQWAITQGSKRQARWYQKRMYDVVQEDCWTLQKIRPNKCRPDLGGVHIHCTYGKVVNPARGQLNRENQYFPVLVRP